MIGGFSLFIQMLSAVHSFRTKFICTYLYLNERHLTWKHDTCTFLPSEGNDYLRSNRRVLGTSIWGKVSGRKGHIHVLHIPSRYLEMILFYLKNNVGCPKSATVQSYLCSGQ